MRPAEFEAALDDERIVAAIQAAEARSRGEVRVHVAEREEAEPRAEAEAVFGRLEMDRTAERNGVLLYVAPESRAIVLIGDEGIHGRCGEDFWVSVVERVRAEFSSGRFTDGIVLAVQAVGDELARHYPRGAGATDRNELPDAVSRG
jgi:uncharacterized membrane protein